MEGRVVGARIGNRDWGNNRELGLLSHSLVSLAGLHLPAKNGLTKFAKK